MSRRFAPERIAFGVSRKCKKKNRLLSIEIDKYGENMPIIIMAIKCQDKHPKHEKSGLIFKVVQEKVDKTELENQVGSVHPFYPHPSIFE